VGKVSGGVAATLVYAEPREGDPTGEVSLGERVLTYLKGIGVLDSRSTGTGADALLLADLSAGSGTVWRHGKRIGTFQLERLGGPDAEPGQG
jgi:hypothetical protein